MTLTGLRHPIEHFYTTHFDGTFVFRTNGKPFVITRKKAAFKGEKSVQAVGFDELEAIAKRRFSNGFVEPLLKSRGTRAGNVVECKMDMVAVYALGHMGLDHLPQYTRSLRRLARQYAARLLGGYH